MRQMMQTTTWIGMFGLFGLAIAGCMHKAGSSGQHAGQARASAERAPSSASARRAPKRKRRPPEAPEEDTPHANYEHAGVNPMMDPEEDALSTFAVDVDTGSYSIARRKLQSGRLPPAAAVRVEEFVNYFGYDYPEPDRGPFTVDMEAAPSPFDGEKNRRLLRVGVQGKHLSRAERKPVHLTFLVDVSGSMNGRRKIGLAKKSLRMLTNNLQEGDTVALATYAGRTAKVLDPTGMQRRNRILTAISNLDAGGSTAMDSGLQIAYRLALKNYEPDHVNRVIVLSDGNANVGPSSHEQILDRIQKYVDEGVTLSTIGFGNGSYRDTMMEQLANNGNGNYYFIDTKKEARKVFGEQLNGTLQVIAKDVKIQVEFDDKNVESYRLIGYENREVKDKNFRNERVDAGEIGAGHTVTALYELQVAPEAEGRMATVRVRHKKPKGSEAHEQAFGFQAEEVRGERSAASLDFQFAAAVAAFAEKLRKSPYADDISYGLIEELAANSTAGRADREEFVRLVRKARRYSSRR